MKTVSKMSERLRDRSPEEIAMRIGGGEKEKDQTEETDTSGSRGPCLLYAQVRSI